MFEISSNPYTFAMSPHIIYRCNQTVTTRKPADLTDCDAFECEGKFSAGTKLFAKQIITDSHELNLLKNDLCFLINDICGDVDKGLDVKNTSLDQITTFYVWVCLPYSGNPPGSSKTVKAVQSSVFPFDLYHHPYKLSLTQIEEIKSILKQDINAYLHTRKFGSIPELPFPIKGVVMLP